jgi:hypothetical protein
MCKWQGQYVVTTRPQRRHTGIRVRLVEVGVVVQLAGITSMTMFTGERARTLPPRETIGHGVVLQKLRKQWSEECTPK